MHEPEGFREFVAARSAALVRDVVRRVRRRRTVRWAGVTTAATVTAVVAAVSLAGASGTGRSARLDQPSRPVTSPSAAQTTRPPGDPAGVANRPDLLTDRATGLGWRNLRTADGRTVSLAGVDGAVETAYGTADGWLVVTSKAEASSLWLVKPDGSVHRLIDKSDREPAVSPDGRRFAWRSGDRMYVGHLTEATVTVDRSTPAPQRGTPIAYTGTAVVLGYSETGGGIDHHDVWLPSKGDYSPSWERTTHVVAVYQPASDGSLLGVVHGSQGAKAVCLARLDPTAGLKASRTACGLPLTIDPLGLVSPDGQWLAAPSLNAGRTQVSLVDLDRVFDTPAVTATWDADAPFAWIDAGTLVVASNGTPMTAVVGQSTLTPLTGAGPAAGAKIQPIRGVG
jgi:hypothetical protein